MGPNRPPENLKPQAKAKGNEKEEAREENLSTHIATPRHKNLLSAAPSADDQAALQEAINPHREAFDRPCSQEGTAQAQSYTSQYQLASQEAS